ncbi:uncharacterized protein LOC131628132 [Vicia villosa]|uniref:uncharacterized protein LOC131628132 n=1 Tax=Vicia villosa TaxID=3911 RepID=UPI00273C3360|nr:uncharacterized protein LOC131628132 [Vicia villosa]
MELVKYLTNTFLYGFGYVYSTDDYFLVLGSRASYYWVSRSIELEIFSLRANKWKRIELASNLPYTITKYGHDPRDGLLLDKAIHWIVYNHETSKDVINTFGLKEMAITEIALPDDFRFHATHYPKNYGLVVHDRLIRASWIKTHEFSIDLFMHYSLSIVCLSNCGDIIATDGRGGLMKFNDKGQLLEYHCCRKGMDSKRSQMALYTESMFSLLVATKQTFKDDL